MSSKLNEIRSKLRDSLRTETQAVQGLRERIRSEAQAPQGLRASLRAETHQAIDDLGQAPSQDPSQTHSQAASQAMPSASAFCAECGASLAPAVKFCPECGAAQAQSQARSTPAPAATSAPTARSAPALAPSARAHEGATPTVLRNNLVSSDVPNLPVRQGCKALCIGMGAYEHNALPWPAKDAQDLSEVLHGLGYQVSTIIDQNFQQTLAQLGRFIQSVEPGDDVVYTYSGHGCGIDAVPNLTAIDTQGFDTLINVYKLMIETAKYQGARSVVIAVDACRGNQYEFAQYPWEGQQEALLGVSKAARVRRPEDEFGFAILYGTSHDTSAFDSPFSQGIQNGMFTYFLKSELTRPGQSLSEIFKRVQKSVMDLSMGIDQFQKPALTNELAGEYYFYPAR